MKLEYMLKSNWKELQINNTKYLLNSDKGTMYEYVMGDDNHYELVSITNEWRCIKDIFTNEKYKDVYK